MIYNRLIPSLCLILLTIAISAHAATAPDSLDRAAAYKSALPQYRYDAKKPLAVKVTETTSGTDDTIIRFSYAGDGAERVPAFLYLPQSAARAHPVPCLILLHGLGGNKDTLAPLAQFVASHGYAALAIDEYGQGERADPARSSGSALDFAATLSTGLIHTVIDVRRGLDYLAARPEVDRKRLCLVGLSMGGIISADVAGIDTRIKETVIISGGGDLALMIKSLANRDMYIAGQSMAALSGTNWDIARILLAPVDPLTFAAHIAPRGLLMVHGREDQIIVPDAADALYNAARAAPHSDVTIQWYPTAGHVPPFKLVFPDVLKWLTGRL